MGSSRLSSGTTTTGMEVSNIYNCILWHTRLLLRRAQPSADVPDLFSTSPSLYPHPPPSAPRSPA